MKKKNEKKKDFRVIARGFAVVLVCVRACVRACVRVCVFFFFFFFPLVFMLLVVLIFSVSERWRLTLLHFFKYFSRVK